jgi:hypothetical protein
MAEKKVEKVEKNLKKDASKTGFDKKLGKLPVDVFEKWFNERFTGDAKKIHADLKK